MTAYFIDNKERMDRLMRLIITELSSNHNTPRPRRVYHPIPVVFSASFRHVNFKDDYMPKIGAEYNGNGGVHPILL